jgi:hypothetical protein
MNYDGIFLQFSTFTQSRKSLEFNDNVSTMNEVGILSKNVTIKKKSTNIILNSEV